MVKKEFEKHKIYSYLFAWIVAITTYVLFSIYYLKTEIKLIIFSIILSSIIYTLLKLLQKEDKEKENGFRKI